MKKETEQDHPSYLEFLLRYKEKILVVTTAAILPLLLVGLDYSKMWAFGDLTPFPTDLGILKDWIFSSWRDEGLGAPNQPVSNYYLVILISSAIFGNFLAQKLLFLSTIAISFVGFYYFQRSFHFRLEAAYLGALCYAINPVIIASLVGGAIGELMTYSVFPIFALYFYKTLSNGSFRISYIAIIGLLTVLLWNNYVFFWLSIMVLPALMIISVGRTLSRLKRLIPLAGVVLFILSPNMLGIFAINQQISNDGTSFTATAVHTFRDISVSNLIRLAGNTGSAQSNEFLKYNELNSFTSIGYILSSIVLFSIIMNVLTKQPDIKVKKQLLLFMSIIFAASIGILIFVASSPSVVDSNSIISSLRNPTKLMYVTAFSFASLFSFGIESMLERVSKNNLIKRAIALGFIPLILFSNYPALDGTAGIHRVRGDQYAVDNKYYELKQLISSYGLDRDQDRILFLPWEYPTYLRIRSEIPNFLGIGPAVQQNNIGVSKVHEIFNAINQNAINKSDFLALYNTGYVVVDKTFASYYEEQDWYKALKKNQQSFVFLHTGSYWISGDPLHFYSLFKEDSNFSLVYEDTSFAIFKNNITYGRIYQTTLSTEAPTTSYLEASLNLIRNPSFEEGTANWSLNPGRLVNLSENAKDGDNSIVLFGQNNTFTNIYQTIKAKGNTWYKLEFSFLGNNMTDLHAKVLWSNHTETKAEREFFKSEILKIIDKNLPEGQWNEISGIFLSPPDAKEVRIQFLASRLSEQYKTTSTFIDKISFVEVVPEVVGLEEGTSIGNYQKIDPTHYSIHVSSSEPYMLALVESYNPSWIAKTKIDGRGAEYHPIPSDSITRFFIAKPQATDEIDIIYSPQTSFYGLILLSLITILGCAGYLTYHYVIRSRWQNMSIKRSPA